MIVPVKALIYENDELESVELLGNIRVDNYDRVSFKTYKHYENIAKYIAGDRKYQVLVNEKRVIRLYEKGKYGYLMY